jgi:hypothetical protein
MLRCPEGHLVGAQIVGTTGKLLVWVRSGTLVTRQVAAAGKTRGVRQMDEGWVRARTRCGVTPHHVEDVQREEAAELRHDEGLEFRRFPDVLTGTRDLSWAEGVVDTRECGTARPGTLLRLVKRSRPPERFVYATPCRWVLRVQLQPV